MSVCCECCVLSGRVLWRRADHSSRGVLPIVVRRCVWCRSLVNEEPLPRWELSRQKQTNKMFKSVDCICVVQTKASATEGAHKCVFIWDKILETEKSTSSYFPENSLRNRLWICRKAGYAVNRVHWHSSDNRQTYSLARRERAPRNDDSNFKKFTLKFGYKIQERLDAKRTDELTDSYYEVFLCYTRVTWKENKIINFRN
jgi:hypothetical protein